METSLVAQYEKALTIGIDSQKRGASISEALLQRVKAQDGGPAGALLIALSEHCKVTGPGRNTWANALARTPLLASIAHRLQGTKDENRVIEDIAKQLKAVAEALDADSVALDTMFDENLACYQSLMQDIAAIREAYTVLTSDEIPKAKQEAALAPDTMAAQRVADLEGIRDRLDHHLLDLELTAQVRRQNAPKIRLIQRLDQQLSEKIRTGILITIPLWQENLAIYTTQQRQKAAADTADLVDETTNSLLRQSADLLHDTSVQVAAQSQRGVVSIETLQHAQEKILATINDTRKAVEESRTAREFARNELLKMESELAEGLRK